MYVPSNRSSPGDAAACSWGEVGPEQAGQEAPGRSRKRELLLWLVEQKEVLVLAVAEVAAWFRRWYSV